MFLSLGFVTLQLLAWALYPLTGLLVASVFSAFGGAAIANMLALRIYEGGRLPDIGLHWNQASASNLLYGTAAGAAAVLLVLGPALATGAAHWKAAGDSAAGIGSFVFVTLVLLFGVVGEEMLFRGYGFQVLVPVFGPAATLLPMSVIFAAAHAGNQNVSWLGLINTFAWGILLGAAVLRSGDLWLAIGLHFGWNWMLPLMGVNLSGFTMRVTGVELEWSVSPLWSGGDYGPEGGLLCTIVLGALVAFLIKAPIRRQHLALLEPREEAV
ncbi:MAG: CPBP family intramembrane glutamic endopeptidase [Bryobacteraceae bacterium]